MINRGSDRLRRQQERIMSNYTWLTLDKLISNHIYIHTHEIQREFGRQYQSNSSLKQYLKDQRLSVKLRQFMKTITRYCKFT